ncbi:MAG: ABC transporter permease [Chloroflexi bacterium]|nr:ABC transporter permease [Chloroflexota bacterium]
MNARILGTLMMKDLKLYFRNRFFAFITIAGVILYIAAFHLLPSTVDESLTLAVYAPSIPDTVLEVLTGNDITIVPMESDAALQEAVVNNEYVAGVALPEDVVGSILLGRPSTLTVYFASDAPREIVNAMRTVLRLAFNELSYTVAGDPLQLEFVEQIVGPDRTGDQLAIRNRLLPLMAIWLLVMETMGLGSLISDEVEHGTFQAVLVTPVTLVGMFSSKAIFGVVLAFVQAALLMGLTGSLGWEPLLILTTLLLGSLVVTGLGFLIASVSRSMMSVMAWGILAVIIMVIPSYGVVFPGTVTGWVQIIPSYYMFDTIHQVVNFGASWGAVASNLAVLLVMGIALMAAGVAVMGRRIR